MWVRGGKAPREAAVIDVGSNSVRLVVYRIEGRAIWTVYNEKVLAGLGRDLRTTGNLSPGGVSAAMAALRRFKAVLDAVKPSEVFTAATAAMRDAFDGPDFARRVLAETGFKLRILTGEEEARYSALGVLAGAPDCRGVVGDLGGASLELTRLDDRGPAEGQTLALGPFSVGFKPGMDPASLRDIVDSRLNAEADRFEADTFHAVGGAWRNLALLHMRMTGYPLHVVHQYTMGRTEALDAARVISRMSPDSLDRVQGISKKRLETLPYAGLVMEALVERLGLERIVVSAYGVREGLLFEAMEPRLRAQDPLVAGCAVLGGRLVADEHLGPALEQWLEPVLTALPPAFGARDRTVVAAACRLADLGATLHPDHRATLVFEQVLRAPIAGQTHVERAFMAVAAFHRHTGQDSIPEASTIARLLPDELRKRARALGSAIRLGCDLSGRSAELLNRSRISLSKGVLTLSADGRYADMLLGEQTARRAATLAQHLNARLEIRPA